MKETRFLAADSWSDFQKVFESTSGCDGCWCLRNRLGSEFSGMSSEQARTSMRERIRKGEVHGVLAYLSHRPVGWMGLEPSGSLIGFDSSNKPEAGEQKSWIIHCIYVDPVARGKGIPKLLIHGALFQLRSLGVKQVEAFAVPEEVKEDRCMSSLSSSLFEKHGFRKVEDIDETTCKLVFNFP